MTSSFCGFSKYLPTLDELSTVDRLRICKCGLYPGFSSSVPKSDTLNYLIAFSTISGGTDPSPLYRACMEENGHLHPSGLTEHRDALGDPSGSMRQHLIGLIGFLHGGARIKLEWQEYITEFRPYAKYALSRRVAETKPDYHYQ